MCLVKPDALRCSIEDNAEGQGIEYKGASPRTYIPGSHVWVVRNRSGDVAPFAEIIDTYSGGETFFRL